MTAPRRLWAVGQKGQAPPLALVVAGHTLRAQRSDHGLTRSAVARALAVDTRTVTRLEGALAAWPTRDLTTLLAAYLITDQAQCEGLWALTHAAHGMQQASPEIHTCYDGEPGWLYRLNACLRTASTVRAYEARRLPRSLWTARYAAWQRQWAARRRLSPTPAAAADPEPDAFDHQVVVAVVDELAFFQPVPGPVMCEQVDHLCQLIDQDRLRLGIVPRRSTPPGIGAVTEMTGWRPWIAAEEVPGGNGVLYSDSTLQAPVAAGLDHAMSCCGPADRTQRLLADARQRYAAPGPLPAPY